MRDWLEKRGRKSKPSPISPEDTELKHFFTDAEHVLHAFEQLVSATRPHKRLLVIHGIGGVGKSTVLKMYRLSCRRRHIPVALVGGEEAPSPAHVLAHWANDLSGDGMVLSTFQSSLAHYGTLRAKVEAEAKKTSQPMAQAAEKMGKAAAKTTVQTVASAIPIVGPLVGAMSSVGAEAFVDWLYGFFSKPDLEFYLDPTQRLTDDFTTDLTRAAARQRIVLMADTYEQMTTLGDWLCDLARQLPEDVLLVIAGRAMPEWSRTWLGWMGRAEIVELKEMAPDDLRTLVCRYYAHIRGGEPDAGQVEAIVEFARGLPIAGATAVELWVKYDIQDFQATRQEVVADLVDWLLKGVPPEMRPVFEAAAVLRYFNADSLRRLLSVYQPDVYSPHEPRPGRDLAERLPPPDSGNADALYAELRRWPFIRPRREGLAVHDTMREMMNEALRVRTSEHFRTLHEQAARYYEAQIEKATGDKRERLTLELLYHRFRADENEGTRLFCQVCEKLASARLIYRLRTVLDEVIGYPLERESNKLWRDYYTARLLLAEAKLTEAEPLLNTIAENERAESRLKAYALCDFGWTLATFSRLGQPGMIEKTNHVLEQSISNISLDSHLVGCLYSLAHVCEFQGQWDRATIYYDKAREFFDARKDYFGLVSTYFKMKNIPAFRGDFRAFFRVHESVVDTLSKLPELPYLKARLGDWGWIWSLAGRNAKAERLVQEKLAIVQQLGDVRTSLQTLLDLGWILGRQGKFDEARAYLAEAIRTAQEMGDDHSGWVARPMSLLGVILTQQGHFDEAREYLAKSLTIKQEVRDHPGIPEVLNWLGMLHAAQQEWSTALDYYKRSLESNRIGRRYFESEALVGVCQARYSLEAFADILPVAVEAEQLAQQHEYNDHLAVLRLTQGHITWGRCLEEWGTGFAVAQTRYQQALIYALRYNRFLLDETLQALIAHCREHGDEGQKMLAAICDFWQTGYNDIDQPRPDTISLIPEGLALIEAERLARKNEPGDGSPQVMVVDQLSKALSWST